MKVHSIMSRNPITVKPSDSLRSVVRVLSDNQISGAMVVNRGSLVGVITQTDIVRAINVYDRVNKTKDMFSLVTALLESKDGKVKKAMGRVLDRKVKDFLGAKVITINTDEGIDRAAALINMHNIDRLPVLENGKLAGIISKSDIIVALEKLN